MGIKEKKQFSVSEAARKLGVTRTQVLRLIHQGKITAKKIGTMFVIDEKNLPGIYRSISAEERRVVKNAVERTFQEYGEVLKRLGKT